ncbi:MAG: ABC transporter substrate-binding protein [Victivallales bacterium]|nr:ABC transporter substrate-binding protein [Victivallales bacterium]
MKHFLTILIAACATLLAQQFEPRQSLWDKADPIAAPDAIPGGRIVQFLGPSPKSLNYYLDPNTMSAEIFDNLYEPLIAMNPQTLEYDRCLAHKWTISEDKLTFTFWLDPNAKWSDGRPITAKDVVWTYHAITDPKNLTGSIKMVLERLNPPVIVEEGKAVRFTAKNVHWQNLASAGGFSILPEHVFSKLDFNKINFEFPVVSGPYRIGEFKEGFSLTLERRNDWWRQAWPSVQGGNNFQQIVCRFYGERDNAFDAFLKGEIDLFPVYTASRWHQIEHRVKAIQNNWIVKQAVKNHSPVGFQGFAMNMRKPPFDDLRVRQAMACLVDRPTMNHTLMYDQYFLHRSFWEDLYDNEHPCQNPTFDFDKARARKLLAEAGYRTNPDTGLLEKNGTPLRFTFLTRDSSSNKFLAIFEQALKDVGIQMDIQTKDWSAWAKDMDAFHFDMTWAAWGAGLYKDPEAMWSSAEANRQGGANITGFQDPRVDELIARQRSIFNVAERHQICREIDAILTSQVPYVLLWNINYTRLLYWNKFGTPPTVLGKYSNESIYYWWYDPDVDAELKEAITSGIALPPLPKIVDFDSLQKPE